MRISVFVFVLFMFPVTSFASEVPPLTPKLLESRNAAAGFAGTLKFAVGRSARTCRDSLGKDDMYMTDIVNDWLSRNSTYSSTAEKWMSFVVSTIANQQGLDKGLAARDELQKTVQTNTQSLVDRLLGATEQEKAKTCLTFPALVHSGNLDITPTAKLYPELMELVSNFPGAAPAP